MDPVVELLPQPFPPSPAPLSRSTHHAVTILPRRIPLINRNITILGKRTCVRLESDMWRELHAIAVREGCTIHELASVIYLCKPSRTSLSSGLRVFVMRYYRAAATEEGHIKASHGDFHKMLARAQLTVPDLSIKRP